MQQFDIQGPALPENREHRYVAYARRHERRVVGGMLFACALAGVWLISAPANFPRNSVISIPPGASAQEFAATLKQEHVIRYAILFRIAAHLTTFDHHLDTGGYAFSRPESLPVVLWRTAHAEHGIAAVRVTIPEGMTRYDIADTLERQLPGFDKPGFLSESSTSEGYLFPETYFFMPGDAPESIVEHLTAQFASSTASITPEFAASPHSKQDIVIMASILEREAKTPEDMRIVAGVLWNRIANGMPLQVDAAFGYARHEDGYVPTAADLASDSPYNTYKYRGLPPTPISNPGLAALEAAADPAKTSYLYYLTGKDGKMHYATTYAGHQKNVALYLK